MSNSSKQTDQIVFPEELVSIVESSEVQELSEKLDRRLGSVGVQLGHVQIVHEEDESLARRRT